MAEIYGKRTGFCHGKGGSMHIADLSSGMLGANGIVGGGPPLVCGAGLTAKVTRTDQVGRVVHRRRRLQPGHVPESLNLAASGTCRCVFVFENNGYAESTASNYHQGGTTSPSAPPASACPA